jgi:AraC-like DNA-binding protein
LWNSRDHIHYRSRSLWADVLEALLNIAQTPRRQHALAGIVSKPSLSVVNHKRNPHDPRAMDCAARFDDVVPRETGRALREPCRLATQCKERVVEQLNHVQRPSRSSRQRPRVPGRARESCVQAKSGLAAWQQVVVAAYIQKHIGESITVRALARFVYLSSHYFCRAFKRSFGLPPHRYLVQQRIERAKALLASSAWSITEIGYALGFRQTRSFSATFRQLTGMTPTEFRQARR